MQTYLKLLNTILVHGNTRSDRTGTGTRSIFGHQMRFDLTHGFPLVTTKRIFTKALIHELLWMLSGSTSVKPLQAAGVTIWDEWAADNGDLGPVYGAQWKSWGGEVDFNTSHMSGDEAYIVRHKIDQIAQAINILRTDPDSRRIIVSAWNVADLPDMALQPCHCLFQFHTRPMTLQQRADTASKMRMETRDWRGLGGRYDDAEFTKILDVSGVPSRYLDCQLYQRSGDAFLGVPFNIASYALLTHMIAQVVGMKAGEFVHTLGDAHIYLNHMDQVHEQLARKPMKAPDLWLNPKITSINDFRFEDIAFENYESHPAIKAPVAV